MKRKTNTGKIKKKQFCEITVSQPKKHNYSTKTIKISRNAFFQRSAFFLHCASLIGLVNNVLNRQGNKMNAKCNYDQK